jgi:hypothetical protein
MSQACLVWSKLFTPFQCQHAHEVAVSTTWPPTTPRAPASTAEDGTMTEEASNSSPLKGSIALARALGLEANVRATNQEIFKIYNATVNPPLEWVRGWPIKPLALLLTSFDTVLMLDADSVLIGIFRGGGSLLLVFVFLFILVLQFCV